MPVYNAPYGGGITPAALALLRPTDTNTRRLAIKERELAIEGALRDEAKADYDRRMQVAQRASSQMQAIEALPFEAPDKLRLTGLKAALKQRIADKIAGVYGGDEGAYFDREGGWDIERGVQEIMGSTEFQTGLKNKTTLAAAQAAAREGETWRPVAGKDPRTGMTIPLEFSEALSAWQRGELPELPYAGSYKIKNDAQEYFQKNHLPGYEYGDRDPKTGKNTNLPRPVAPGDYATHLVAAGNTPADVADYLRRNPYRGGLYWGMKEQNPLELAKFAYQQQHDREELGLRREANAISRLNAAARKQPAASDLYGLMQLELNNAVLGGKAVQWAGGETAMVGTIDPSVAQQYAPAFGLADPVKTKLGSHETLSYGLLPEGSAIRSPLTGRVTRVGPGLHQTGYTGRIVRSGNQTYQEVLLSGFDNDLRRDGFIRSGASTVGFDVEVPDYEGLTKVNPTSGWFTNDVRTVRVLKPLSPSAAAQYQTQKALGMDEKPYPDAAVGAQVRRAQGEAGEFAAGSYTDN